MKKERIAITTPCHEDWDKMNASEKGKFCDSCSKEVHDVSTKTDLEIARAYHQNQGDLCIRIPENRISVKQNHQKKFGTMALAFLISCWLAVKTQFARAANFEEIGSIEKDSSKLEYFTLKGHIVDSLSEPWGVPFAMVRVFKEDDFIGGGYSDVEGNYNIKITGDDYFQGDSIRLEISMFGYDTAQRTLAIQRDINADVFLQSGVISLNELKVVVDRRDLRIVLGGAGLMMGKMRLNRSIEYIQWDQYDTKTFSESEINRYQLGRDDTDYSRFSTVVD
ncbi:MAG: hypothetical protein JXR19_09650 [Bacteroidia bacterium]